MAINKPDIIIRRHSNELPSLWLSEQYLCNLLPSLSPEYLRVRIRPSYKQSVQPCFRSKSFLPATGKAWRWGKANGTFYYDFDFIPDKEPNRFQGQLPSRKQLMELKKDTVETSLETSVKEFLQPYINNYTQYYHHYATYTRQQQEKLAKAAAFLVGCAGYIHTTANASDRIQHHSVFKTMAQLIRESEACYLPKHYRNLQKLIQNILQGKPVQELVHLKRSNNTNAVRHEGDKEIKSWILNMRQAGENYTNAFIISKVKLLCKIYGKSIPSDRWIGTQMEDANMRFLTASGRFGESGRFGQPYRFYTPFANALYAGDCWQVDGSRINLTNFKEKITITDATGNTRTVEKEQFITVVAVRDVHSGDVLGHCYNLAENRWTYIQALKMAVETAGYLPYEIVFDKFPGHNTEDFKAFAEDLTNRGVKVTFTYKAQGKAKMERWFSTLQTVFMQDSQYYYGEGIQSRRAFAHRSKEYLHQLRKQANKEGWNWDAACNEADRIIEAYRTTKLSEYSRKYKTIEFSPAELQEQSEKPNTKAISPDQFAYLFGIKRKERIANGGLITLQVNNVRFNYRCSDYDVISKYKEIQVAYMLEDMSSIHLYEINDDKALKMHLGKAQEIPDIVPYGPDAFNHFGKQQAILKQLSDFRNQELEYKKAVGYDSLAILSQGGVNKQEYEAADAQATITILTGGSDDAGDDIREQYS